MVDWKNPPRLFIPGPVKCDEDVLQQMSRPTLGHRGKEYAQLQEETVGLLKQVFYTDQNVFLSTSSASGIWEAAIRNCIKPDETVLSCCCGAFSDKWADVVEACGRKVDRLKVEWGQATTAELIDQKLASGNYTALDHGLQRDQYRPDQPGRGKSSAMLKSKYPDVLVFVDSVSAMVGLPLKFDELGWDITFASVQKAFAIPPGFAVALVSNRCPGKGQERAGQGLLLQFRTVGQERGQAPNPGDP